jgi:hypothetical protein
MPQLGFESPDGLIPLSVPPGSEYNTARLLRQFHQRGLLDDEIRQLAANVGVEIDF